MKLIVCLGVLVILALVQAQPVEEEYIDVQQKEQLVDPADDVPKVHQRQKRATCDLLSFWNVKNTACAAHCLTKGFKGGYCNNKSVCVCRR